MSNIPAEQPKNIIPPPKFGATVKKEVLRIDGKTSILTTYDKPESASFFIGGDANNYCIYIYVSKGAAIAKLMQIYYDAKCYTDGSFQRGTDTEKLIPFVAEIVRMRYPYVQRLEFTDTSYRYCGNKYYVNLSLMYYLTTGQTWYEKKFGAYLPPEYKADFDTRQTQFQQRKHSTTWSTLRGYMPNVLPMDEGKMKELFESSQTWYEFFGGVMNIITKENMCGFLALWVSEFMVDFMKFNFAMASYLIDIEKIPKLSVQIQPYTRAGRRRTRRIR